MIPRRDHHASKGRCSAEGRRSRLVLVLSLFTALTVNAAQPDAALENWPRWRGPLDTGEAPLANPPLEWSEEKNIRWKLPLPGLGHSTPIVWNDRIFVTAAIPHGKELEPRYSGRDGAHNNLPVTRRQRFAVIAIDRAKGKILWQKTVRESLPVEGAHESASLASASPLTDGSRLYASFGSQGLYCMEFDGTVVWEKQFGQMHTKHGHGEGASPSLHGGALIVNWDHQEQSFIVALNKNNGREIWKKKRDEVTSWATPIVVKHGEGRQVIVPGTDRMRAYDLKTGDVIWECGGLSANICASPVAADGMVYAGSSYVRRGFVAVNLEGARGDITGTDNVAWTRNRGCPYVPSPLLYRGRLYFFNHYQSVMARIVAKTGKDDPGLFRLPGVGNFYASPVAAKDRVYMTDLSGMTLVMSAESEPTSLAFNKLDDSFSASAAMAGKEIFLRGAKSLYCIAETKAKEP